MPKKTTRQLIDSVKKQYKLIGSVYCKPIKARVIFNRHGWNHAMYKSGGHRRNDQDIQMRLNLIPYAPEVIRQAMHAKQDIREETTNAKKIFVTYTEVRGIVDNRTKYFTVVIRKFPDCEYHYYSIKKHKALIWRP
ncbi:MAG: hypothetical protein WCT08_00060 [Patescibacteria group bacterium]|jgi:hypothetical protein